MYTLNCKGKLLELGKPVVMGVINASPDSFYNPGDPPGMESKIRLAAKMVDEGATILDIGGQSTRPGSNRIPAGVETERVVPLIEALSALHPGIIISIDTYQSRVAEAAVLAGASIINDISGGTMDPEMIPLAASLRLPYVCSHILGTPENMQQRAIYTDVVKEVLDYFIGKIAECREAGIYDVLVDPGFGFAKTIAHNFQLLKQLKVFGMLDRPLVAGLSRKATVYKTLGITAGEAGNGTTVLNTLAVMNGAHILRVHDVKEAMEVIRLVEAYNSA
jgi:dihydropteroate synthase